MNSLITIEGYRLPEPSAYNATTSTIVDSARSVNGYVVGSIVRDDVAKIEVSWRYISVKDWANILSRFTHSFYNNVTFFNQSTGTYVTRKMYVSDRNASAWRRNPQTGEMMGWVNASLSLVEV